MGIILIGIILMVMGCLVLVGGSMGLFFMCVFK